MAIKNCPECGILHTEALELCRSCQAQADAEFKKLAEYVRSHPGSQAEDLAKATKIPVKIILEYLTAGRLQVAKHVAFMKCAVCKTPILTGTYCEECALLVDTRALKRLKKTGTLHPVSNRRQAPSGRLKKPYK
jgi:hypothetical protein